ncbi:MAG: hypothetical protein JJU21_02845 [Salinarimonas sp.]|nr:hypothetical protein [Salinarimonas sp.]
MDMNFPRHDTPVLPQHASRTPTERFQITGAGLPAFVPTPHASSLIDQQLHSKGHAGGFPQDPPLTAMGGAAAIAAPATFGGGGAFTLSGAGLAGFAWLVVLVNEAVNPQHAAAPTLDDPAVQAMLQQMYEDGETFNGEITFQLNSEGEVTAALNANTRAVIISVAEGSLAANPDALPESITRSSPEAWDLGIDDPLPGLSLPSNILAINPPENPEASAFERARTLNAEGAIGDMLLVLDLVGPNGDVYRGFVRGGLPELMAELLVADSLGLLPAGMSVLDMLARSGIVLAEHADATRAFIAERSLRQHPLTLFGTSARAFASQDEAQASARERNADATSSQALTVALPVETWPVDSPLDTLLPGLHQYLGHVTYTGSIAELLQFFRVLDDQGRLPDGWSAADILRMSGVIDAARRIGVMAIVVGEASGALPDLTGLTPQEREALGLPGSPVSGAEPASLPGHPGFPVGPHADLDGATPEPELRPDAVPGGEYMPNDGDPDLRMDMTSFPAIGDSVPIPEDWEGTTITDLLEPLTANPPLDPAEKLALAGLAMGADPHNADARRMLRVALAKIGAPDVDDIDVARRFVFDRIGKANSVDVLATMLGDETARLLQRYPEILTPLLRNPQTIQSLSTHPDALRIVLHYLRELEAQPIGGIEIPDRIGAPSLMLPAELYEIARRVHDSVVYPDTDLVRQEGFDAAYIGDAQQTSQYVNQLYADSAAAKPILAQMMHEVAAPFTHVDVILREQPKSRARIFEKIEKYGGDPSRITDLAAGRFVADDIATVYAILDRLEASGARILSIEDRLVNRQPSGHGDITMTIEIPLEDGRTHVAEIQIQLRPLFDFSQTVEHALYEVIRSLRGAPMNPPVEFLMTVLRNYTARNYNELLDDALEDTDPGQVSR